MKEFICWLIGHNPRGPVKPSTIIHRCDRCYYLIRFYSTKGWMRYHD